MIQQWKQEEQQPFVGWDFSYLDGRMMEDQLPWSYTARAAELMQRAGSVVDLDTGGGELLLELKPHWPRTVVATEHYPPNVLVARERLVPAGALLLDVEVEDDSPLPFADASFDLVLNRHAAFHAAEIARVLTPGGTFLTQQVHGMWAHDLLAAFDATPQYPHATPEQYVPRLKQAGMDIVTVQDWNGALTFADVGAIVYYLKATPWEVPGFSVDTHAHYLLQLQARLDRGEPLVFTAKKYLIEAHKGAL